MPHRPFVPALSILVTALALTAAGCSPDASSRDHSAPAVRLTQTPADGLQPMAKVDKEGTVHLIYFKGEPGTGDIYYVRRTPGDSSFSKPVRVNSTPGSAIAIGTVRGAHLALGQDGRVHVAWMGSEKAVPRGPGDATPMLYAHSTAEGRRFTEERNLIRHAFGLDGGGTVAADAQGRVHVLWHAGAGSDDEAHRRVWKTTSTDGGQTFARETAISPDSLGACGCCGMAATVDTDGHLYSLYRGAEQPDQRDMYLLASASGETKTRLLEKWPIEACPMSTSDTHATEDCVAVAWESQQQVAYTTVENGSVQSSSIVHAPGSGENRKHPAVAVNEAGRVLMAWTEGTGWGQGGSLHWQVFDPDGTPTSVKGSRQGVPTWSRPTALVSGSGDFEIVY